MSDDDMIEMGAMMDDLEECIAEKDALLATQAAQIEALTKALKEAGEFIGQLGSFRAHEISANIRKALDTP